MRWVLRYQDFPQTIDEEVRELPGTAAGQQSEVKVRRIAKLRSRRTMPEEGHPPRPACGRLVRDACPTEYRAIALGSSGSGLALKGDLSASVKQQICYRTTRCRPRPRSIRPGARSR